MKTEIEKIHAIKEWVIHRSNIFLSHLEKATDEYEIEGQLYTLQRVFETAFNEVHRENKYSERP